MTSTTLGPDVLCESHINVWHIAAATIYHYLWGYVTLFLSPPNIFLSLPKENLKEPKLRKKKKTKQATN